MCNMRTFGDVWTRLCRSTASKHVWFPRGVSVPWWLSSQPSCSPFCSRLTAMERAGESIRLIHPVRRVTQRSQHQDEHQACVPKIRFGGGCSTAPPRTRLAEAGVASLRRTWPGRLKRSPVSVAKVHVLAGMNHRNFFKDTSNSNVSPCRHNFRFPLSGRSSTASTKTHQVC